MFMDFELKEKIWQLAEPLIEAEGMELIHVECVRMHTRWIIRLYLDKENGVTIDDCANISNQLSDLLDVHDVVPHAYTLEVSSPGPNRPISRDVDFIKYKSRRVNIKTNMKIDGLKNFTGVLVDYKNDEKTAWVEVAGKTYRIPRKDIVKANLTDTGQEEIKSPSNPRRRSDQGRNS